VALNTQVTPKYPVCTEYPMVDGRWSGGRWSVGALAPIWDDGGVKYLAAVNF